MNVNELMIGDWIEYNNETMEVIFNARVTEVGKGYIKTDHTSGDECFEDEVEPIHITAEILERNGWHFCGDRRYSNNRITFELLQNADSGFTVLHPADEYGTATIGYVENVHELQHLIRILEGTGIKEIEL